MAALHGTVGVYHFDQMVKDTIEAHGYVWAWEYYCVENKVPYWQFRIFSGRYPNGLTNQ